MRSITMIRTRPVALPALALIALAGCSLPGSGASGPTPSELSTSALKNLLTAANVDYKGTIQRNGITYTVDVTADRKSNVHASIGTSSGSVEVIGIGSDVYRKGDVAYWSKLEPDARTQRAFASSWVKVGGGSDQDLLRSLTGRELERDLQAHFKPTRASSETVSGTAAQKLSGSQGDLWVTSSSPLRPLSFTSTSRYANPSGFTSIRFAYTYPSKLDVAAPSPVLNPDDQSTWPAQYQVERETDGACSDTSCTDNVVVRNVAGPSMGQAKLSVTFTDGSQHNLGMCTADIPPISHDQTETVLCTVSGQAWMDFNARGGGDYYTRVDFSNPPYDS